MFVMIFDYFLLERGELGAKRGKISKIGNKCAKMIIDLRGFEMV